MEGLNNFLFLKGGRGDGGRGEGLIKGEIFESWPL